MDLQEIIQALEGVSKDEKQATIAAAFGATKDLLWVPNPGPQTDALHSDADELFFGGQAGGGKSDLGIGAAITQHHRSLLLRRTNKEARGLVERMSEIIGNRDGWSGQTDTWRLPSGTVEISGCQLEEDRQKFKGVPRDLYLFDEVSDFMESQYTFIIGWNRSTRLGQRCRVIATGNPPTTAEGLWVIRRWAAWLDPTHPNPAKPGELRWYTTGEDGDEIEVDGPGPYTIGGESVRALSRTFIPSKLSDNPDLQATNYAAVLAALPAELRAAYRDGRFDAGLKDKPFQLIPTAWVKAAQARWTARAPDGIPMCAVGVDASGGSTDPMIIARRYGHWFDALIEVQGKDIPADRAGAYSGGLVLSYRKDQAEIVIDMSGGYGGPMYEHLKSNHLSPISYKGGEKATGRDRTEKFTFANKRTRSLWRLREALDPESPEGIEVYLPPDTKLLSDLTAPTYEVRQGVIHAEPKESVVKRLGRSTDRGDAVAMAYTIGLHSRNIAGGFANFGVNRTPSVVMGHSSRRR